MQLKRFIPILQWLPSYTREQATSDIPAGLTVGVMLIPQGMAYALLAGLPPIYGLYGATIPIILYAIFGTSRQLAVGPVAMVSLLVASGVSTLAAGGTAEYLTLAIMLGATVGVVQLTLGLFRLGFLVNFLSNPVIAGYTAAAALIIGLSQLQHLLGLSIPRSRYVHEILIYAVQHVADIHWPTLLLGSACIAIILLLKRINRRIPGPLVAVVLSILAVWLLHLHEGGMKIVGEVPEGLPALAAPTLVWDRIPELIPIALTIALVSFMESNAVATLMQAKHKHYKLNSSQELVALGLANISGSFFSAFPVSGGFSRTAVNDQAGAQTPMASIVSAILIVLTLLFLTPLFYLLPKAVLASVIMVAVFGLINFKGAIKLWKTDRRDFVMLIITFITTLGLGIQQGILTGVALSLGMVLYRNTYPHVAELGKLPGTHQFRNVSRFSEVVTRPDVLMMRFDAQLFFANSPVFRAKLAQYEAPKGPALRLVVLDFAAVNGLDSTALNVLQEVIADYKKRNIEVYLTSVKGPIRDILYRSGLMDAIGRSNFFLDNETAMDHWDCNPHPDRGAQHPGVQTNLKESKRKELV